MSIADLDKMLDDATRAFLDTSTCIAYHSTAEAVHPLARHVLGRIADADDPLSGFISTISAVELLIRPIRAGGVELSYMHTFVRGFPNLRALPVDLDVALQAANIRAIARLSMQDALIVATAMLAGCDAIVTNDRAWSTRLAGPFPAFRWVCLADYA